MRGCDSANSCRPTLDAPARASHRLHTRLIHRLLLLLFLLLLLLLRHSTPFYSIPFLRQSLPLSLLPPPVPALFCPALPCATCPSTPLRMLSTARLTPFRLLLIFLLLLYFFLVLFLIFALLTPIFSRNVVSPIRLYVDDR